VYAQIEKEASTVISLTEGVGGFTLPAWLNINLTTGVKTEERITFTKNLSAMLAAGLTLSRALSVIQRQAGSKGLKEIVTDLEARVKKGDAFNEALASHPKVFSPLFIAMTKAGEESGTLADSLKVVAKQMDRSFTLEKKIKGAMIYPCIILFAVGVIGILMMIYVVPTLSSTFKDLGAKLPQATLTVIAISDFMSSHVIVVFAGLIGGVLAFISFTKTKIGGNIILAVALSLPVIGTLVRETYSARAARAISSLLASGVEMLSAIAITEEIVGDNRFGKIVNESGVRVKKGEALSSAYVEHPKLYPVFFGEMIAVGEETGQVAGMLGQVAEYYENDVEEGTKDLSTIIEPMLMLFIGAFVGVFAVTMISPIYSLSSQI
jgi:type IV pilus assembly protein PilC